MKQRLNIRVSGIVQGVGFRPHVYQVAITLGLTGWVNNNSAGVVIEVQGARTDDFIDNLMVNLPPLAKIEDIVKKIIDVKLDENSFIITASEEGRITTKMSPDAGVCDHCVDELFDPSSRFYHYPFINCTHCGPRFSITRDLPYDRKNTSMQHFPLCRECLADYQSPHNRRYHAQPVACAKCGPVLSHSIDAIVTDIKSGKIVALKGLGGYHLACNALDHEAVLTLRKRKFRDNKPFAIMVSSNEMAKKIVQVSSKAEELLTSWQKPIVLLPLKTDILSSGIAPGLNHLGIMLPYTPLHHLLFEIDPSLILVMTSANRGGKPLVIKDNIASTHLQKMADVIVSHNREILTRVDDSVMGLINDAPYFIRRARGIVPGSIRLPYPIPETLGLGGHLKNTICVTRGQEAFVSQYIGDLNNAETIEFFHETLEHMLKIVDVKPTRVACDLHPDFYTTQFAYDFGSPVVRVQHHYAHMAAVLAEHQHIQPALGLILDGYGYGKEGQAWGGELVLYDGKAYRHLSSLKPIPQVGGDRAAREPWRMGLSVLSLLKKTSEIKKRFPHIDNLEQLLNILDNTTFSPLTSSCGRLFDAASAILGVCPIANYEGQAAMQLESLVTKPDCIENAWIIDDQHLNFLPLLNELLSCDQDRGANIFHGTLAAGLFHWIVNWSEQLGVDTVILSGGCFLNRVLSELLMKKLTDQDFNVLFPTHLPPNDGAISLGQAWYAATVVI